MTAASLARAIELDDPYPDDVCPGCQQNITGWEAYDCHYKPGTSIDRDSRSLIPWPFTTREVRHVFCDWTSDYLNARRFRRRYIARGTA